INHDSKIDLVAGADPGWLLVFLGVGDGSFGPVSTIATSGNPWSMSLNDLDGDGNIDVAFARGNCTSVMLGNGVGGFAPRGNSGGGEPQALAAGDLDGNGSVDLVVSPSGTRSLAVLRNTSPPVLGVNDQTEATSVLRVFPNPARSAIEIA